MKKNQGAKARQTYTETYLGAPATDDGGLVGFYLDYRYCLRLKMNELIALETLKNPSSVQVEYITSTRSEVARLKDEFISLTIEAPKHYPNFLTNLSKANSANGPAYAAGVRMLSAYAFLRYVKPIEEMSLQEMLDRGLPEPAKVFHQELLKAIQVNGCPTEHTFSRMVKLYPWMILTKGKSGPKRRTT